MSSSAGVLPFSRNGGEIVFLVGRDIRDSVFSDFGGKLESVDKNDPIATATREFYEESLGVVCNSPHDMRQRLKELSVCLFGHTKNNHEYRMYMLEIPYCKDTPRKFMKMANFLKYKNVGVSCIEKTELVWCSMDELMKIPKRAVFTETLQANLGTIRRLETDSWRDLCKEFKSRADVRLVEKCSEVVSRAPAGKYIPPTRRCATTY
ncbi:hypothetical protein ATCVMN08101_333L [Acanthocystis turfacea Chlorella virus MN0810.1]|nr:hypothetical protein ATCVMN08101_333L [Acanthocystis turfacea Chlorella virus MN0810.1]